MRARGVVVGIAGVIGGLVACGETPPSVEEPILTPVDPAIEATLVTTPRVAEPPPGADVGRGDLPAPVADALEALFPQGRRLRCAAPADLPAEGALGAVWLGPREEHLRGPTLQDGWFAAAAPTTEGTGVVLRDGRAVATVSWARAASGAWAECTIAPVRRFQVLGLVQDGGGKPVAGATVRGCEPGDVATTNDKGRFELQGVAGRTCPVFAVIRDADGFGKSETQHLEAQERDGIVPDLIVELEVPPERLALDQVPDQARRFHGVLERQLRNGTQAELDGFRKVVGEATLSADARAVADGWVRALEARVAEEARVVEGLARADVDGLYASWLADF